MRSPRHLRLPAYFCALMLLTWGCSSTEEGHNTGGGEVNQTEQSQPCLEIHPRWVTTAAPAAVAFSFEGRHCETGEVRRGLSPEQFEIKEEGVLLAGDHEATALSQTAPRPYLSLVVDGDLSSMGAAFVDGLFDSGRVPDAHLRVGAAGGEVWHPPIDDRLVVAGHLDDLTPGDLDEHSWQQELDLLGDHLAQVYERNRGGLLAEGHLILVITDEVPPASVAQAIADARGGARPGQAPIQTWFVDATDSADTLTELAGSADRVFSAASTGDQDLLVALSDVLNGIADYWDAAHQLRYCSPARGGETRLTVEAPNFEAQPLEFTFSADGFTDGCEEEFFDDHCEERECGGLLCGGCADDKWICGDDDQCVYYCLEAVVCEDVEILNELGHEINCYMGPTVTECDDSCVDTSIDDDHCGGCGQACTHPSSSCVDGACYCDDGSRDCDGECIDDLSANPDHCGTCGNACPDDVDCESGQCVCDDGLTACNGACVDLTNDVDHCGSCQLSCQGFDLCDDGQCACDEGRGFCDGACVDIFSDDDHCGGCGQACEADQTCENASCQCIDDDLLQCSGDCVDVQADDDHCGSCNNACGPDLSCDGGDCLCTLDDLASCDGACTDLEDDPDHCGSCGNACPEGVACIDGHCDCGALTACGGDCVDVNAHPGHCGDCDEGCVPGEICDGGDCLVAPVIDEARITTGNDHSCLLPTDGMVDCWGSSADNQTIPPSVPFLQISAGHRYTCGVRSDSIAHCWGRNLAGESVAPWTHAFVQVDAATSHTCGVTTGQEIRCWGSAQHGKTNTPSGSFTQVSTGHNHTCGLRTDGTLHCWGQDDDEPNSKSSPPPGTFIKVAAGMHHSCAIDTDGALHCWGEDSFDQLDIPDGVFHRLTAGATHSCAIDSDEEVHCWGNNSVGQTDVESGSFTDVAAGFLHTCALATDGEIHCWGDDDDGQSSP